MFLMVIKLEGSDFGLQVDKSKATKGSYLYGRRFDFTSGEMVPFIDGAGADVNFALRD